MTGLLRTTLAAGCVLLAGCRYGDENAPFWGSHVDAGPPAPQCSAGAPRCGACAPGTACGPDCECIPTQRLIPALRSTNIAVRAGGGMLAAALRDANAVGVWTLSNGFPLLEYSVQVEDPRALAWDPNRNGIYVLGRTGLHLHESGLHTVLPVCAEPMALVLSPSGATAYVGCLEGVVVEVDLPSFTVRQRLELRNAYTSNGAPLPANAGVMTLALTNNGDANDDDETLVVPLFWADPVAVAHPADADLGGLGVVALLSVTGNLRRVDLLPTADTGFGAGAFMNQLSAVTVDRGRAYVAALAASPRGPAGPAVDTPDAPAGSQNVFPMVAVVDVATGRETARLNINALLRPLAGPRVAEPSRRVAYLSTISSLAFVEGTGELLVVSVASDAMVSLLLDEADGVVRVGRAGQALLELGRPFFPSSVMGGGGNPYGPPPDVNQPPPRVLAAATGVALIPRARRAFVVGEVSQTVRAVDVERNLLTTPENFPDLALGDIGNILAGRTLEELRGKFFFFTSTGRWGNQGMAGCLACHPGGGALPDGVTWYFSPGPRQTISLESLYGKTPDVHLGEKTVLDHRAQTWTANTDELADLEGNTRNVSGGFGALVTLSPLAGGREERMDTGAFAGLNGSADWQCLNVAKEPDWIDVAAYLRTLRKPAGVVTNALQVDRGRTLFEQANCAACHGGSKWSSSQIPYPSGTLTGTVFPADLAHHVPVNLDGGSPLNTAALVIEGDDVPEDPATGVPNPRLERLACVLRNVDTYFVDGGQSPLEIRGNMQFNNWAQGRAGFNPPPLTGLRYGAPFLHRGQAATLRDLLTDPAWAVHRTAGNGGFNPTPAQVEDLVAFLESIDDSTPVVAPPAGYNNCPRIF